MEFQTPSQLKKENLIKIIFEVIGGLLILLIFLMLNYFGSSMNKNTGQLPLSEKGAASQKEAVPDTLPMVVYNLAGPIKELQKDSLIFEASIPQLDERGQQVSKNEIRTALITGATKFRSSSFVAQEDTNQKTLQETVISFNDLKKGDLVEVVSNKDISQAQVFEATLVRILQ